MTCGRRLQSRRTPRQLVAADDETRRAYLSSPLFFESTQNSACKLGSPEERHSPSGREKECPRYVQTTLEHSSRSLTCHAHPSRGEHKSPLFIETTLASLVHRLVPPCTAHNHRLLCRRWRRRLRRLRHSQSVSTTSTVSYSRHNPSSIYGYLPLPISRQIKALLCGIRNKTEKRERTTRLGWMRSRSISLVIG